MLVIPSFCVHYNWHLLCTLEKKRARDEWILVFASVFAILLILTVEVRGVKNIDSVLLLYQDDFLTPGSSPFKAFKRNWNLHNLNSRSTPLPWPVATQRLWMYVGEEFLGMALSWSCAWWRTRAGNVSLRVMYLNAWRVISLLATAWRALISRSTRHLILLYCMCRVLKREKGLVDGRGIH